MGEEAEIPADGSAMTHPHEKLELEVTIEKQGYIYVYLSVDDRQNMDVYWDDFKVTHKLNDIVAGGDYYPFGLAMSGRQITRDSSANLMRSTTRVDLEHCVPIATRKIVVNFRYNIGSYRGTPTRYGIIHSGRHGVHIPVQN